MPELPEVETVRRGLAAELTGRRIVEVTVGRERTVRRTSPGALAAGLEGSVLTSFSRHGKYLFGHLHNGLDLMVHLRMSGQLLVAAAGDPVAPHTHVRAVLDDGRELRFVDPRTFGEMVVYAPHEAASLVPELARLGPDALDDLSGPRGTRLLRAALRGGRSVKTVLCDQTRLAGLGNIYADEALHAAAIRTARPAGDVGSREAGRLRAAIVEILADAVAAGGSTLGDAQYVDLLGRGGGYQHRHRVYGRAGMPCLTCGTEIRRVVLGGRSSCYCPRCQRR
jgi:formamidopyrimidine-DNA glycosylase